MIVQVDPSGWNQDQKNMVHAMSVKLLFDAGVTYDGIRVSLPDIIVLNSSKDVSGILTKQAIAAAYQVWRTNLDVEEAAAVQEEAARAAVLTESGFTTLKVTDIDALFLNVNDLAALKVVVKRIVKFLVAKNRG